VDGSRARIKRALRVDQALECLIDLLARDLQHCQLTHTVALMRRQAGCLDIQKGEWQPVERLRRAVYHYELAYPCTGT
jgi:hypothetical protein